MTTESSDQKTQAGAADTVKEIPAAEKARVYKNLIIVGLMLLLSYSSTSPTVTLVTSIAGKTLGNVTFFLNYVFSCLSTLASISVLSNGASKKKILIVGNACLIGFAACNWYVSYFTLIPGTVLFGFGVSVVWIASLMYTSKIAVDYAKRYDLTEKSVASFFTGIVVALASVGYLLGNATTAGVLTLLTSNENNYYNDTDSTDFLNSTNFDKECRTNDAKLEFNFVTVNILRGIIVFYSVLALAIIVLFLDDIDGQISQTTICRAQLLPNFIKNQWQNIVFMAKIFIKKETMLLCLLCFALGAGISFVFTGFTKVNSLSIISNFGSSYCICVHV